jgi:hypothetical protein
MGIFPFMFSLALFNENGIDPTIAGRQNAGHHF